MALWHYLSSIDRVGDRELEDAVKQAFPGNEGQRIMATVTNRWIQEGMQRGAAATARENVLEVLETRFHSVPQILRTRIERLEDLAMLSRLHRIALTAASPEDVVQGLDDSRS